MTHVAIHNGSGHYCSRCSQSWDQGEPEPETCVTTAEETATGVGRGLSPEPADSSFLNGGPATEPRRIVIALCGEKGAGKDTAATPLLNMGFANVKMADGLKIMLRAFLAYRGADQQTIHRMVDGDLKETPSRFLNDRTPRHAMQTLGDWGRDDMHIDLWLDGAMDRLDQVGNAIITDVRNPNEANRVRGVGIPLYRVERPDRPATGDTHSSETQIRDLPVDGVLRNIGVTAEAFQAHAARQFRVWFGDLTGR